MAEAPNIALQQILSEDPRVAEFALGALVGMVLIAALSRLPILRAAVLLLLFIYLAQALLATGVDGLMADVAQLFVEVRANLAFFQGLAIGKLLGGLVQVHIANHRQHRSHQ